MLKILTPLCSLLMLLPLSAAAQEAAAGPNILEQMMPFVFIFVIFYFLLIRPQQKRQREHGDFLSALKKGDSVLTSAGMLGTIEGLTEKFVTLEVAQGVRVRILRNQIASKSQEESK